MSAATKPGGARAMVRAAILTSIGGPLEILDDGPRRPLHLGEARVALRAVGVCGMDFHARQGWMPMPLPAVLGHEGAGVVTEVGDGVRSVRPGERVMVLAAPRCGTCFYCAAGQSFLCDEAQRAHGAATFAEETVCDARALVALPPDLPFASAAVLACGAIAGAGAAFNSATIRPGQSVAVIGAGGVGVHVIQGARIAHARDIVAVDVDEYALGLAGRCGATALVDARSSDPVQVVMDRTGGRGADVTFEVVGDEATVRQAFRMTRPGGEIVIVGSPPPDVRLGVPVLGALVDQHKTVKGSRHGGGDITRDVERIVDLYRRREFLLDELVGERIALDGVNEALARLVGPHRGRTVIEFREARVSSS